MITYLLDVPKDVLPEYLPSKMTPTKMADVTYIDLDKYVIVQLSKWVDRVSRHLHIVEYRNRTCPPPADVDTLQKWRDTMYDLDTLEKWRDGVLVETLSARELLARIKNWTYGPEPTIPVDVWRQLGRPSYDVLMQWTKKEGDDIHLVEIRKYHMERTFNLIYDGECIYHGDKEMLEMEKVHCNKKPGLWDRIKKWNPFRRRENIKSLLLELEALGDDSLYKS